MFVLIPLLFALFAARPGTSAQNAVYLYGIEDVTEHEWAVLLQRWPSEGIRRAIVSLESGPRFLLEQEAEAARLGRLFQLAAQQGIQIEGMVLQDPAWALQVGAAVSRLSEVIRFAQCYPGALDAVHIDVEVYTADQLFRAGDGWERYRILVSALREELGRRGSTLKLTAAAPWWIAYALGEGELGLIAQALDGMLLMAYGDPGGQVVAADIESFRRKVQPALQRLSRAGIALRVGVAKYEHGSAAAMRRFCEQLDRLLAPVAGYSGAAIFHERSPYRAESASTD